MFQIFDYVTPFRKEGDSNVTGVVRCLVSAI